MERGDKEVELLVGTVFYQKENKGREEWGRGRNLGAVGAAEVRVPEGEQPALTAGHCPQRNKHPCQHSHKYDDKGFT